MMRLMLFMFFGVMGLIGIKEGSYSLVTYLICLSVLAFLFWGCSSIFGGDGLVARARSGDKLSLQERDDMEFLRNYSSKYDWLFICGRAFRGKDLKDHKSKSDWERITEERWKLRERFDEIEKAVSDGKGSKEFINMALTRMAKIRNHNASQSVLNSLEP